MAILSPVDKTFTGKAARGEGRAGALGFPTANIPLSEDLSGIFAAVVAIGPKTYHAAVFADPARRVLEAHLLDFWGELYDQDMSITLQKKLRDTAPFENDEALRAAIAADVKAVRDFFEQH